MLERGFIQVYTGDGKGKTTAAIGLAIRALGAGKKVLLLQFMKSKDYSEQLILSELSPNLTVKTSGKPFFVAAEGMLSPEEIEQWGDEVVVFQKGDPPADYVKLTENALSIAGQAINQALYDLVILDELNVALFFGLAKQDLVEDILKQRSPNVEIVFTGRNAPQWLLDRADLVTEMLEVKHYYQHGVVARRGFEN